MAEAHEGLSAAGAAFLRLAARFVDAAWLRGVVGFVDAQMAQDGGHDYGHLWRVLSNARRIYEAEANAVRPGAQAPSWEAIAAAVLLHDVVNLPKDHPERHLASLKSADAAAAFLSTCAEFPPTLVPVVADAIAVHSFSSGREAETPEARIVTDADRLESIGAFAIARTFYVSGRLARGICDLEDPFADARALDHRAFGVDHFFTKLLLLRDRLFTPAARALAEGRHARMEAFLDDLGDELGVQRPAQPRVGK